MMSVDEELTDRVRQRLARNGSAASPAAIVAAVRAECGAALGDRALLAMADELRRDLIGAGPLDPLLADPRVTDVLVNGREVWCDRGAGLVRVPVRWLGTDPVRRLAQRLAAGCGRALDDAHPFVDARLPDGTRLHAMLPPVAPGGPYLSLRTFRHRAFGIDELIAAGTITPAVADVLIAIVDARLAYLVTGGTGSGKTTMLSTLLGQVPVTERIVVVEDAAELRPSHPHVVGLTARPANAEGAGEVTLRDLVRQALRMRPDRLVIGECRGAEIVELLAALNTGHEGGAGTLHANAPRDVPARLEALGLLGGLERAALHAQLRSALRVVLHLRRSPSGRVLDEICLLTPSGPDDRVLATPVWHRGAGVQPAAAALARLLSDRDVPVPSLLGTAASGGGA
ncbi:TadA family conjugal transfer-associated ATPase [Actinocatenispora sera]|nr:TadA family conjugal transfer-associated ATPase [Actinocatenispora sera]